MLTKMSTIKKEELIQGLFESSFSGISFFLVDKIFLQNETKNLFLSSITSSQ